jgi:hypothetical protein
MKRRFGDQTKTGRTPKRFFPSLYYVKREDIGKTRLFETAIHKVRDGLAVVQLIPTLCEVGYSYGGAILNVPLDRQRELRPKKRLKDNTLRPRGSDMVVLSTRPALDDKRVRKPKKRGPRRLDVSHHPLENTLLGSLLPFFEKCSRSRVTLADIVGLEAGDEHFRDIKFRVQATEDVNTAGAVDGFMVQGHREEPPHTNLTVGYVLGLPSIARGGPRLLVTFGMGGTETLWLTFLLARPLRDELRAAITARCARMRLISFRVPRHAPFPLLEASIDELEPRVIATRISRRT